LSLQAAQKKKMVQDTVVLSFASVLQSNKGKARYLMIPWAHFPEPDH
jgi:hypothetical protein